MSENKMSDAKQIVNKILEGADIREEIQSINESSDFETFINFITGQGTILVKNEKDFNKFVKMLKDHNCEQILKNRKTDGQDWNEWLSLASINGLNPNCFVFEYQPGKGISWYDNVDKPTSWYGVAPMSI